MSQVTQETILLAINDLSGFAKDITSDMREVRKDITDMKQDITNTKQEMQQMNEKIDANHRLTRKISNKITIFSEDHIEMRMDVLELQRTK